MSEERGWYPDPYFLGRERYWDGDAWTEQCRTADSKQDQPSARPRPPKNPETATPSATAAKAAAKAAAAGAALATLSMPPTPTPAPRVDFSPAPPTPDVAPPLAPPPPPPPPPPLAPVAPSWEVAASAAEVAAATGAVAGVGATDAPPDATAEVPAGNEAATTYTDEPPAAPEAVPLAQDEEPTHGAEPLAPVAAAAALLLDEPPALTEDVLRVEDDEAAASAPPTKSVEAELTEADEAAAAAKRDVPEAAGDDGTPPPPPRRRRRRLLVVAAVVVVLAIAVGVVAVLTKGATAPGANAVSQAASATIAQQYALVDVGVNMSGDKAAAATVSGFSASGTFDLPSSLGSMTLTGPGSIANELMVLDGQTMYLDPGGLVGQLVPNKLWLAATADDLGSTSTPTGFAVAPTLFVELVGSPTTLLRQLEAPGSTATAIGSSIYHGTPVEEYNVTLSPQAINTRLHGLPSTLRGDVASGHASEQVFLTTNGLVRAISVPITVENNGAQASGRVVIGYSAWGSSADISAPPASQVVSWDQFKAVLTYTSHLG